MSEKKKLACGWLATAIGLALLGYGIIDLVLYFMSL